MHKKNTNVRRSNKFFLFLIYNLVKFYFFICGVRVRITYKCQKKLEGPCIVLCNHGSFVDFFFAGKMLMKSDFNFVAARLYFYHKWLGKALRLLGCFPKSMFTTDLESTKNCMRVLKEGRVLAMMPEARLSTAGEFEDIQESTYSFLKKLKVPVYTIVLRGDYFADPKWGSGFRRGSIVEATMDKLFTPEQLETLSVEEICKAVEERLYYQEYDWLSTRPNYRYNSKKLALGLENILALCPSCGKRHTLITKGCKISCEHCGFLTNISDRYAFDSKFRFQTITEWYQWQKDAMQKAILEDPKFYLESKVELRHGDNTGKNLTRHSGYGICRLDRTGLTYTGTEDGEECSIHFPMKQIYRLLFGAGVNFEVYQGSEIYFFVPEEKRSAVDWYMASSLMYDMEFKAKNEN